MDSLSPGPLIVGLDPAAHGSARYLRIWALSLAILLGAVAGFCALIDPYAVIGTPIVAGLNARKTAAIAWPRLSKAYMIQRLHPVTLVLGNSSADVGINPDSAAWAPSSRPVFNLAVDGGLPRTHLRYLQHALATGDPAHVVIAINFNESLVMPPQPGPAAALAQFEFEPRMRVLADGAANPDYARAHLADLVFATLSFSALSDSVTTMLHQNSPNAAYQSASGWNSGAMMAGWARDDGAYAMVERKDREKIAQFSRWLKGGTVDIDPVFQAVRLAVSHGADVQVVILPNHADGLEVLRQLGMDRAYDAWKAAIVEGVSRAAPDGRAVIWDFSGYSPYTTEDLPAPGVRGAGLRWFYEPVHFKADLGDLMIARLQGRTAPGDFGVRLTRANLPQQIADYHAGQATWLASHPSDITRIAALVQAAR